MVRLDDAGLYDDRQMLTKMLQEILLDYEPDSKLQVSDSLHEAIRRLRNEAFNDSVGGRSNVPHLGRNTHRSMRASKVGVMCLI